MAIASKPPMIGNAFGAHEKLTTSAREKLTTEEAV